MLAKYLLLLQSAFAPMTSTQSAPDPTHTLAPNQAQATLPSVDQSPSNGICLFTGLPPAEFTYTELEELGHEKGSYGSVNDILPKLVSDAKARGADAIIHYNGAQHFGFWPWRLVRPIVEGTAIKWTPARNIDCAKAGGHYTTGTLAEAPPPPAQ